MFAKIVWYRAIIIVHHAKTECPTLVMVCGKRPSLYK